MDIDISPAMAGAIDNLIGASDALAQDGFDRTSDERKAIEAVATDFIRSYLPDVPADYVYRKALDKPELQFAEILTLVKEESESGKLAALSHADCRGFSNQEVTWDCYTDDLYGMKW